MVRVVDYYERTPMVAFEGRSRQVSAVPSGAESVIAGVQGFRVW